MLRSAAMARKAKLKVFRTPIGFHDAYVAAPSQKAALAAWGSDRDLFARGVAERVDDPALMREPLAHPGEVIRRSRGTTAEQIAALPKDAPKRPSRSASAKTPADEAESGARARAKARAAAERKPRASSAKPKPPPDRNRLEAAERALTDAEARHREERRALARREAELAKERRQLEKRQAAEQARLAGKSEAARKAYERAVDAWRG